MKLGFVRSLGIIVEVAVDRGRRSARCTTAFGMRMQLRRSIFFATLLIASLVAAEAERTSADQPQVGSIFSLQLETDKTVYRAGEAIAVRLSIRNTTGSEYGVRIMPPWLLSNLLILDAREQTVPPSVTPSHPGFRGDAKAWGLMPGKLEVPGYYALDNTATFHEWTPIAFWGYQLVRPGFYTIVAIPYLLDAWAITSRGPEYLKGPSAPRSAPVRIQVVP
jgi:hypothetical protein